MPMKQVKENNMAEDNSDVVKLAPDWRHRNGRRGDQIQAGSMTRMRIGAGYLKNVQMLIEQNILVRNQGLNII